MRPARKGSLAVVLTLALVGAVGCGGEEPTNEAEDSEYLAGQEVPPPSGKSYLAVFMTIENKSDEPRRLPGPAQMSVVDTTGAAYEASPSNADFAVPLGSVVPGDSEVPEPGSAGASGPAQGAIVLFLVDQGVPENRPLELEIEHEGETGTVTLDI